jgi:hypothetical protein
MIEKITIRILYYTSKTILILSIIFLIVCVFTVMQAGDKKDDNWSMRDQSDFWTGFIGSYWFLRILLIIVVSYITLISVEPYYDIEEKKIKQLEDEAKENKTQK